MCGSGYATALGLGMGAVFASLLCYVSIRWRMQLVAMAVEYRLSFKALLPCWVREPLTRFVTAPPIIRGEMILGTVVSATVALYLWVMLLLEIAALLGRVRE